MSCQLFFNLINEKSYIAPRWYIAIESEAL